MNIYRKEIIVQHKDLDELNHVNNVVYLQWVQDIASAHWQTLATEDMLKKYSWVVLKHEIEYFGQAFLNDHLQVSTWVDSSEGFRSIRQAEFHHTGTKKLLVRARTTWCLLDSTTLRLKRIEQDIYTKFHGGSS
ncbi:MAG: acyl-CoA thioesterase [Cyclobacteriaceae bacterium]|jgi:acyl-CoA thioester hydrolase|nr:acyl-CoA thioesterase [Cyclobacteriaceae bacterium]